jgi:predicted dehydrogenase
VVRIIVVGLGPMGLVHTSILNSLPGASVVAAVDKEASILSAAKAMVRGIDLESDLEAALRDHEFDAVYVCTPVVSHAALVKEVLRANRSAAVFVEKPLASSLHEADELVGLANATSNRTMVGFHNRFNGCFMKAESILKANDRIGEPRLFRARLLTQGPSDHDESWRSRELGGGVLLDWGCHLIDLLLWLIGRPSEIQSFKHRVRSERVWDYSLSNWNYPSGLAGTVEIGWKLEPFNPPDFQLEIFGTKGVLVCSDESVSLSRETQASGSHLVRWETQPANLLTNRVPVLLGKPEYTLEDMAFIDMVQHGLPVPATFEEGRSVHEVIERLLGTKDVQE